MNDLVTMCLLGVFVIVGLMLLSRIMGSGFGGTNYTQRGNEYSHYDDPNINSHGGFGGNSGSSGGMSNRGSGPAGGRVDNPNIRSRGSFGRSK